MTNRVKSPGGKRVGALSSRDAPRRATTVHVTAAGAVRLPGLAFAHRLAAAPDAYGRPFALLTATPGTHSVVIAAEHGDPVADVSDWAATWSDVVASLGDHPRLVAATTTTQVDPAGARRHIGLTWRTTPEGRRPRLRPGAAAATEAAVLVGGTLPKVCSTLESALDAAVAPLTAQALSGLVRSAYDPSVARLVDTMPDSEGPKWSQAAPRSSADTWDHLVHDGCASVSWVMSGVPAHEPLAGLVTDGLPGATTTRLSLLHRRSAAKWRAGTAMLLTATYPTVRQARDAALDHLSLGTQVRLRRAYGCQAAAFAAALPLGVPVPVGLRPPQIPRHVP